MRAIIFVNNSKILALTSTKHGGVSKEDLSSLNLAFHVGDSIDNVQRNRELLFADVGINEANVVLPHQTHSINVYKVTKKDCGSGRNSFESGIRETDALYTREKRIPIGVFHADCLPIFLFSLKDDFIMIIHAGWQGSVKEITFKTISRVLTEERIKPENLSVILGPAILKESLEIKDDVINLVKQMSFNAEGAIIAKGEKTYLDLIALNTMQLKLCGIKDNQITNSDINTFIDNRFYSYRKQSTCGRHLSVIMLK